MQRFGARWATGCWVYAIISRPIPHVCLKMLEGWTLLLLLLLLLCLGRAAGRTRSVLAISPDVLDHDNSIILQWGRTYFHWPIPRAPLRPSARPPSELVGFGVLNATVFELLAFCRPSCNWGCIDLVLVVTSNFSRKMLRPYALGLPPPLLIATLHHREHAAYAFYTSPFTRAVVVSMDGQGTYQQSFVVWLACREHGLRRLPCDTTLRLGSLYGSSGRNPNDMAIAAATQAPDEAYAAEVRQLLSRKWNQNAAAMATWSKWFRQRPPNSGGRMAALYRVVEEAIIAELLRSHATWGAVDGLALGGGLAANIGHGVALSQRFNLSVWRPGQPSDATLGFGALWTHAPPSERPVVHFAGRPVPIARGIPGARDCEPFTPRRLRQLLSLGAVVGVWQGRAPLEPADTPGHQTAVSCANVRPTRSGVPTVLVNAVAVPEMFVAPARLTSPSHAFLLRAQAHVAQPLNISWAQVAAVEEQQDRTVDHLLEGAKGCRVPLLFCTALQPRDLARFLAAGPQHYVWSQDSICKSKG